MHSPFVSGLQRRGNEPTVRRRTFAGAALVAGFALVGAGAAAERPESCDVSAPLSRHLTQAFPGWKVLTSVDLSPDHRQFFARDHPAACPGQVFVNFFGDPMPSVALSLMKPGKALLVLARQKSPDTWSSEILEEGSEAGVLWKQEAGEYEDVYGDRRLRVAREGVVWCGYESWAILYAWVDGRVEKIWLSD